MASRLSPETREANLAALASADVDVLVVGGGITGAGVARDAALRGLSVALVERTDWAAGTSSRSSKLIHGGVRYLQQGDLGLVREAAAERGVLRRVAPHLTVPLRVVLPTYGLAMHTKLGLGLWTFERVAALPGEERHETWSRTEAIDREPTLDGARLHGAIVYTEYLTDDARLVLDTVKGAHEAGALCVNHLEAVAFSAGPVTTEVMLRDTLTGTTWQARGRVVVNAAGPWVDEVRRRAGALAGPRLHLTKGVHLVVARERLPVRHMVAMPAHDRRTVFAVPRGSCTYLGTTDTDYGAPADQPEVTAADADYLLEAANRTFVGPPLTRRDVIGAWAGLRPLLHEEGKRPTEISRKDEILTAGATSLVSVAGGKLTTHRRMAERVVDEVGRRLGRESAPCRTDTVPLPGGELTPEELLLLERTLRQRLPRLPPGGAERLVQLYGAGCQRLLARVDADPAAAEPVGGQRDVPRAEIEQVLEEEMALTLEDILERRTRLLPFDTRQGLDGAEAVAALAAARLGWNAKRTEAELAAYRSLAASLRRFP
jgi:glycerol-3-phosphate dehydrogenase